ncbi:hypothetical protein SAMN05444394_1333 [Algoriphagus halophilus]|uniref:Uncharacterized protein n=1 Tax=Algoriphagus halophilus TaxID=226505 RepID=A0A1N6DSB0_9BACT|nr:hypothetical protein SAMN05444394_1333 [Algoriphagus halophilus]
MNKKTIFCVKTGEKRSFHFSEISVIGRGGVDNFCGYPQEIRMREVARGRKAFVLLGNSKELLLLVGL